MRMRELQERMDAIGVKSVTMVMGQSALRGAGYWARAYVPGHELEQVRGESIEDAVLGALRIAEAMPRDVSHQPRRREVDDLA